MKCKNHHDLDATGRCTGCAETFCENCLVEVEGRHYCGSCKVMALGGRPLVLDEAVVPCSEANSALAIAIISLFCFGIVLGPWAVVKAGRAKEMIAADPLLSGRGKAVAAQIIGILSIVGFLLTLLQGAPTD